MEVVDNEIGASDLGTGLVDIIDTRERGLVTGRVVPASREEACSLYGRLLISWTLYTCASEQINLRDYRGKRTKGNKKAKISVNA